MMNDVSATGLGTPGSDWFIFAHWIGNDKALHNLSSGENHAIEFFYSYLHLCVKKSL